MINHSSFMKSVKDIIRARHMALAATEKTYCYWIRFFIRHQGYKYRGDINPADVTGFLTHLAVNRHVSPNTQNQAFSALLFLFRHVLALPLENINAVRAKETVRIPVVLTSNEVNAILSKLKQPYKTMIQLAWGTGMRKMEIFRLRIKDVDFERRSITVREGKGRKDRVTILPECTVEELECRVRQSLHFHSVPIATPIS
jgi:integrase